MRLWTIVIWIVLLSPGAAFSHLQLFGSELHVAVHPDRLLVRAEFLSQEIPLREGASVQDISAADVQAYGEYFISHVRISVDETKLKGRVSGVKVPENVWHTKTCEMEFDFPTPGAVPPGGHSVELDIRQFLMEDRPDLVELTVAEIVYLVRVTVQDRVVSEGMALTEAEPFSFRLSWPAPEGAAPEHKAESEKEGIALVYMRIGIHHILGGLDHLLFVAALVLAATSLWDLIKVVSVFTVSHTLTLCLSGLDIVRVPAYVVEPLIAASIVFVAVQNMFWPRQSHGKSRLWTAFFFGLFHGLGFAGAVMTAMSQMPGNLALIAIASFSLGVEIGHQILILPLFAGVMFLRRWESRKAKRGDPGRRIQVVGSGILAVAGILYFISAVRAGLAMA